MKLLSYLLLFAMIAMSQGGSKPHYDLNDAPSLFEKFMKEHYRIYRSKADKKAHYKEFVKSLIAINILNEESSNATFDINLFADYTPAEQEVVFGMMPVIAIPPVDSKPHYDLNDAPALFEKFIKDYNRDYTDQADKDAHYKQFVKTLNSINKLNADSSDVHDIYYDINKKSDYTPEEQKYLFGLRLPENITYELT